MVAPHSALARGYCGTPDAASTGGGAGSRVVPCPPRQPVRVDSHDRRSDVLVPPLVWWIGAKLVEERERACDEEVLSLGSEPHVYAGGIVNVCKLYVESPLVCVSGVTGSNLNKRIEAIMTNRVVL